jgi:predicted MFS family arabinose efflux permease
MRRDLGLIVSGVGVSAFGTCLSQLVLMVHFKEVGAIALSAFMISSVLPASLGAPVAGLLVDRLPNRRLMQAAQLIQAVTTFAISLVIDSIPAVLFLMLVIGCCTAVAEPAAAALIPHAAGPGDIARGYSWMATTRSTGFVLGTAAGGMLVAELGARPAILLDAATYLVQACLLLFLKVERRGGYVRDRGGAMAGLRHLRDDRVLVVSIGGLAVVGFAIVLINVADVFFITDVLHGSVVVLGWVYAAWMVGSVIGAKLGGRLTGQRSLILALGLGGVTLGLMILLPALFVHTAVIVVTFVFGGIANAVTNVARQALVRVRTPEHLHGRAFAAADSAMRTAHVLGMLVGGVAVAGLGSRTAMALAGATAVLAGVGMLVATRERATARAV